MKKKDNKALFSTGVIFVAVGVVFMTSVNKGLGAAFIAFGIIQMAISRKPKKK